MIPNSFDYLKVKSMDELFEAMQKEDSVLLAGGTDVCVVLREEKISPKHIIDIKAVPELKGIKESTEGVWIGASELIQKVVEHDLIQQYPALVMGAGSVGCYEIRCRATIGGNICNGSPSADSVSGLLVYDAIAVIASKDSERKMPLAEFLLKPGKVDLNAGEVLKGVIIPKPEKNSNSVYYRRSRVKGMDLSGISCAVYSNGLKDVRIALGAVWPTVARAKKAEDILNSEGINEDSFIKAVNVILEDVSPRKGSLRANPEYKKAMIGALIKKGINQLNGGVLDE